MMKEGTLKWGVPEPVQQEAAQYVARFEQVGGCGHSAAFVWDMHIIRGLLRDPSPLGLEPHKLTAMLVSKRTRAFRHLVVVLDRVKRREYEPSHVVGKVVGPTKYLQIDCTRLPEKSGAVEIYCDYVDWQGTGLAADLLWNLAVWGGYPSTDLIGVLEELDMILNNLEAQLPA